MSLLTTLNAIRRVGNNEGFFVDRWEHLLKCLGKTEADDTTLAMSDILKHNGIEDTIRALITIEGHEVALRLFACRCAEILLHAKQTSFEILVATRSSYSFFGTNPIEMARKFILWEAEEEDLNNAFAYATKLAKEARGEERTTIEAVASVARSIAKEAARYTAMYAYEASLGDEKALSHIEIELRRLCNLTEGYKRADRLSTDKQIPEGRIDR